jgi:ketosteroid isomerase-like protein
MNNPLLPQVVADYIDASNAHDVEAYMRTFSESAVIIEESIGKNLTRRAEIENYFVTYFVRMNTRTEIISYSAVDNVIDMYVLFKGDFPGKEITGSYQFTLLQDKIGQLTADLV